MDALARTVILITKVVELRGEMFTWSRLNETFSPESPCAVSETIPLNPLTLASVIFAASEWPVWMVSGEEDADMEKSGTGFVVETVNVTVFEDVLEPLVPLTITVYVPAAPSHESVEVPEVPRVILVGLKLQLRPVEGETEDASTTVPAKPPIEDTITVDVPKTPVAAATLVGLGLMEKPTATKLKVTVAEWDKDPLVDLTVTA